MKLLSCDMSHYNGAFYPEFNPLVVFDENGIPQSHLKGLTQHMESVKRTDSGVYNSINTEVIDNYFRSSSHCHVNEKAYQIVKDRLDFVVDWQMSQQKGKHNYVLSEPLQFLRYDSANLGKFLSHTDNAYYDSSGNFVYTSPHRVISMITYLNDTFEGGELVFANIRDDNHDPLIYKPKAGTTVLFPSDIRYPHEVRPVTKGVRYCVVGWYNLEYDPE